MARNFDQYPKNVGILAMDMYFPSRVSGVSFICIQPSVPPGHVNYTRWHVIIRTLGWQMTNHVKDATTIEQATDMPHLICRV